MNGYSKRNRRSRRQRRSAKRYGSFGMSGKMKIGLPVIALAGVALYFFLSRSSSATGPLARQATGTPSAPGTISIGGVKVPSLVASPVLTASGNLLSSGVNALTSLLTPSAPAGTPTETALPAASVVALATPTDQTALESQIASGFTGFGRYGLLVAASMPARRR